MTADVEAQFWRIAQADLEAAERLAAEEPLVEQALFHCQQAGENALKCLIARSGSPPPRSHDLLLLAALSDLPADAALDADAALLTQYAVAPRYPLALRPYGEAELSPALAAARRMLDRVRAVRGES
ncbi:MAG: HEPN domain-containing protein [Longimicrobiales bacterium]